MDRILFYFSENGPLTYTLQLLLQCYCESCYVIVQQKTKNDNLNIFSVLSTFALVADAVTHVEYAIFLDK